MRPSMSSVLKDEHKEVEAVRHACAIMQNDDDILAGTVLKVVVQHTLLLMQPLQRTFVAVFGPRDDDYV